MEAWFNEDVCLHEAIRYSTWRNKIEYVCIALVGTLPEDAFYAPRDEPFLPQSRCNASTKEVRQTHDKASRDRVKLNLI